VPTDGPGEVAGGTIGVPIEGPLIGPGGPMPGGPMPGGPMPGGPMPGGPIEGGPIEGGPIEGGFIWGSALPQLRQNFMPGGLSPRQTGHWVGNPGGGAGVGT
jgi:hypothetical protein